ncbi:hypothetical protein cyc_00471 [Cyclospora cayetanensis]|uniref:Tetratricopeptide repeat-containing protein n=1 Tax=Cyclospora cayetanensis TaxID=88456 RepID=A0A1D3CUW0_9EIME|nr:hypothetical protein cyc_00471 [Cyclospora cayetanensis]
MIMGIVLCTDTDCKVNEVHEFPECRVLVAPSLRSTSDPAGGPPLLGPPNAAAGARCKNTLSPSVLLSFRLLFCLFYVDLPPGCRLWVAAFAVIRGSAGPLRPLRREALPEEPPTQRIRPLAILRPLKTTLAFSSRIERSCGFGNRTTSLPYPPRAMQVRPKAGAPRGPPQGLSAETPTAAVDGFAPGIAGGASEEGRSRGLQGGARGAPARGPLRGPPAILAAKRLERRRQREGACVSAASSSTDAASRGLPHPLGGPQIGGPRVGFINNKGDSATTSESDRIDSEASSSFDDDFEEMLFLGNDGSLGDLSRAPRSRRRKRKRAAPFSSQPHRKRRKRRSAASPSNLTPEVQSRVREMMRQATDHYLSGNYEAAVSALKETIRKAPGLHDPFHLLGLVFEEAYGDKRRALDCYLLAAHLVGGDALLWQRSGLLAVELEDLQQAAYCFRRCLRNIRESDSGKEAVQRDVEAKGCSGRAKETATSEKKSSSRAVAEEANGDGRDASEEATERSKDGEEDHDMRQLEENVTFQLAQGAHERACAVLQPLHSRNWGLAPLSSLLAFCLHKSGRLQEAREVLEATAATPTSSNVSPEHSLLPLMEKEQQDCLNMLCEIDAEEGRHSHCLLLIQSFLGAAPLTSAPLDLAVKLAAAGVITGKEIDPSYLDTYLLLADAFIVAGRQAEARRLLQRVLSLPQAQTDSGLSVKLAKCCVALGSPEEAIGVLQSCLSATEASYSGLAGIRDAEARLLLSSLLREQGNQLGADCVLLSISFRSLWEQDALPSPLPTEDRERQYRQILSSLSQREALRRRSPSAAPAATQSRLPEEDATLAARFLSLVTECELDTRRVMREAQQRRVEVAQGVDLAGSGGALADGGKEASDPAERVPRGLLVMAKGTATKRNKRSRRIQHQGVKKDLGLKGIEDFAGRVFAAAPGLAGACLSCCRLCLLCSSVSCICLSVSARVLASMRVFRGALALLGVSAFQGLCPLRTALMPLHCLCSSGFAKGERFLRERLEAYCEFLRMGAELLGSVGRFSEAVAVLEDVQGDWKQKRHTGSPAAKKALKESMQLLALTCLFMIPTGGSAYCCYCRVDSAPWVAKYGASSKGVSLAKCADGCLRAKSGGWHAPTGIGLSKTLATAPTAKGPPPLGPSRRIWTFAFLTGGVALPRHNQLAREGAPAGEPGCLLASVASILAPVDAAFLLFSIFHFPFVLPPNLHLPIHTAPQCLWSWVIRQLLGRPSDYALCLMAGHFCISSCRWRFAAAEYTRALYRCPKDALAALCLAAAFLAHATTHALQGISSSTALPSLRAVVSPLPLDSRRAP